MEQVIISVKKPRALVVSTELEAVRNSPTDNVSRGNERTHKVDPRTMFIEKMVRHVMWCMFALCLLSGAFYLVVQVLIYLLVNCTTT